MGPESHPSPGKKPGTTRKGAETRAKVLQAAEEVLHDHGYAGLTTRTVAARAGVQLSQIHYHFGSRRGVLLGLFEALNDRLVLRQTTMFALDVPLWKQWELACDYLDEDIDSGYVRILNELAAAGWSEPVIGDAVRKAMARWHAILSDVAARAESRIGGFGPLTAADVATLVGCAFIGAEMQILSGHEAPEWPVRRALRRIGDLIRNAESASG